MPLLPSDVMSILRTARLDGTVLETVTLKPNPRKSTDPVKAGRAHWDVPHKSPLHVCRLTPIAFTLTAKDPYVTVVSTCPVPSSKGFGSLGN